MKLLAQLNPRPRGFGDGSYYRMRDLSTTLKMTAERCFDLRVGMTVGSHSERSDNEVEESKKKIKQRSNYYE